MKLSCNGCRVLRKGCTHNCIIRPCLHWIKSPDSQAHATLFLAKFYGRAGLLNLLQAGPHHLRPAIFRSLLYEACGRVVNPIHGSVGLMWCGNWTQCQAAVDAVLNGIPITQHISSAPRMIISTPPLKSYDIRHLPKDLTTTPPSTHLNRVSTGNQFKPAMPTEPTHKMGGAGDERSLYRKREAVNGVKTQAMLTEENEVGLELSLGLVPLLVCPGEANN